MGLRSDAEQDLAVILETSDCGAVPIILVNPAEEAEDFNGQSGDISQVIDPDTGQAVSGRLAHVSLRISTILSRGFEMPRGIARESQKPWLVISVILLITVGFGIFIPTLEMETSMEHFLLKVKEAII